MQVSKKKELEREKASEKREKEREILQFKRNERQIKKLIERNVVGWSRALSAERNG